MKNTIMTLILLACGLALTAFAGPVNVNTADATTLANELNGVGTVKAEAIVAYRKAHGRFESLEELEQVKGIGDKTIADNKDDILFSDPGK